MSKRGAHVRAVTAASLRRPSAAKRASPHWRPPRSRRRRSRCPRRRQHRPCHRRRHRQSAVTTSLTSTPRPQRRAASPTPLALTTAVAGGAASAAGEHTTTTATGGGGNGVRPGTSQPLPTMDAANLDAPPCRAAALAASAGLDGGVSEQRHGRDHVAPCLLAGTRRREQRGGVSSVAACATRARPAAPTRGTLLWAGTPPGVAPRSPALRRRHRQRRRARRQPPQPPTHHSASNGCLGRGRSLPPRSPPQGVQAGASCTYAHRGRRIPRPQRRPPRVVRLGLPLERLGPPQRGHAVADGASSTRAKRGARNSWRPGRGHPRPRPAPKQDAATAATAEESTATAAASSPTAARTSVAKDAATTAAASDGPGFSQVITRVSPSAAPEAARVPATARSFGAERLRSRARRRQRPPAPGSAGASMMPPLPRRLPSIVPPAACASWPTPSNLSSRPLRRRRRRQSRRPPRRHVCAPPLPRRGSRGCATALVDARLSAATGKRAAAAATAAGGERRRHGGEMRHKRNQWPPPQARSNTKKKT